MPDTSDPTLAVTTPLTAVRGGRSSEVISLPPVEVVTASDAPELAAGERVGRYRVIKMLGRGGMGCVYAAQDDSLRREVALKVLPPTVAGDAEARARLLREARAAAAIAHDNAVTVFEAGQDGGRVFLAMQRLHGKTLHHYLQEHGKLTPASAVRIAREVASGLAAAHALGLLHRDIKPANVMLESPRGRAKILDFGLVSAADGADDARLTDTNLVLGTPAYMSPEQARKLPLDARTDLYSLGTVLYEMLSGRRPFTGPDSVSVLTAMVSDPPPSVRGLAPAVPERLDDLVRRLLDKDPAGRPVSATEVVDELRAIERELFGRTPTALAAERWYVPASPTALTQPVDPAYLSGVESETLPVTGEVAKDDDTPTDVIDPRQRVRRSRSRKRRERRREKLWVAMIVGGVLAVGLVVAAAVLANLSRQPTSAPPATVAAPQSVVPPPPSAVPTGQAVIAGQQERPPDPLPRGRPPLPPWWREGMPLPPEFHRTN